MPEGLDPCEIPEDVLKLYALAKAPVNFARSVQFKTANLPVPDADQRLSMLIQQDYDAGSNNWVVSPERSLSGHAILADDPHRSHRVPSLRYIAHLSGPGIDVIGAGEPALPGISIGHNQHIAFGLTIFAVDQEDLMAYETKKRNPLLYRYGENWESMRLVSESIEVRGEQDVAVELRFTRHGPVIYENRETRKAFAVKAAWLEPGMAPYFGSVEYMRAENWDQFLAALNHWGAPAENQVYADTEGNIGYKPAGLTPIRSHYDGLLPVPGDGRYEWQGFYDMDQLPVEYNPARGWVATANAMNLPEDYPYQEIKPGFEWTAPWRVNRISEVLSRQTKHSLADSLALQRDYLSIPARRILSRLKIEDLPAPANAVFKDWDFVLAPGSGAAALFELWFRGHLMKAVMSRVAGVEAAEFMALAPGSKALDSLVIVEQFEKMSQADSMALARSSLNAAIEDANRLMGNDTTRWKWGSLHKIRFKHPLYDYVDDKTKRLLSLPVMSRGGSTDTPNNTTYVNNYDVASGASWRMVIDLKDWDSARMTNGPGQSGDPHSKHYDDLLENWANDGSLPLLYSRKKIESELSARFRLLPTTTD